MSTILMTPGAFHWALLVTDANGVATRYHWREHLTNARDGPSAAEFFQYGVINPTTTYTNGQNAVLAYLKISGYRARSGYDYTTKFSSIFPQSYSDVRSNRQGGISCQTWVMNALNILAADGLISRPYTQPITALEKVVITKSLAAEATLTTGAFSKSLVEAI